MKKFRFITQHERQQYWTQDEAKRKPSQCYCAHFGCGKKLSLTESLAGNKCTEHMNTKKLDPIDFISHPIKRKITPTEKKILLMELELKKMKEKFNNK